MPFEFLWRRKQPSAEPAELPAGARSHRRSWLPPGPQPRRRQVIVLGMTRSGTSLTTSIVAGLLGGATRPDATWCGSALPYPKDQRTTAAGYFERQACTQLTGRCLLHRACAGCRLAQLLGAQGAGSPLDQVLRRLRIAAHAARLGCEERECGPPPLRAGGRPCPGRHVEPCAWSRSRVGAQGRALRTHPAALVAEAVAAGVHHPVPPPGRGRLLVHPALRRPVGELPRGRPVERTRAGLPHAAAPVPWLDAQRGGGQGAAPGAQPLPASGGRARPRRAIAVAAQCDHPAERAAPARDASLAPRHRTAHRVCALPVEAAQCRLRARPAGVVHRQVVRSNNMCGDCGEVRCRGGENDNFDIAGRSTYKQET
eukprot:scaffold81251_cov63-Phaeocystis_antarctica.AAC.2